MVITLSNDSVVVNREFTLEYPIVDAKLWSCITTVASCVGIDDVGTPVAWRKLYREWMDGLTLRAHQ
jgi:hypothetical protein